VTYLGQELDFPDGTLLMTGTGIVPPEEFSLRPGDEVSVVVGDSEWSFPYEGPRYRTIR